MGLLYICQFFYSLKMVAFQQRCFNTCLTKTCPTYDLLLEEPEKLSCRELAWEDSVVAVCSSSLRSRVLGSILPCRFSRLSFNLSSLLSLN